MSPQPPAAPSRPGRRARVAYRTRLTLSLLVAGLLPVVVYGAVSLVVAGANDASATLLRVLLLAIAVTVLVTVMLAAGLVSSLTAPLRAIVRSVERVSAGGTPTGLDLPGDDELSRLAEGHLRLARDLERRSRVLHEVLEVLGSTTLREPPDRLAARAAAGARDAFGMIDCRLVLGDPQSVAPETPVPGEAIPVRALLVAAGQTLGVAVGHLPATRPWDRADQDLFTLFALEISAALRNAELFARVERQNQRLVELDAAKDDFLRGVSHNLQTPLASIRGYAQQLAAERPDRRLGIVTEQADRLSRMVRQLLTVSRLESGALRPRLEVFAPGPRVRRTWEALGAADVAFTLDDQSAGWLALADPDQLDQVLWALLDNAVSHGGRTPIEARVAANPAAGEVTIAIADHGPGVAEHDRERLFRRFERGTVRPSGEGSGLGLYVSRELCRAMGGELVLEPPAPGRGATFTITLPAEAAVEA